MDKNILCSRLKENLGLDKRQMITQLTIFADGIGFFFFFFFSWKISEKASWDACMSSCRLSRRYEEIFL